MYNTRKKFLFFITTYLFCVLAVAQNDINSPYSRFGIGNLSPRTNSVLASMGGVGYALQNPYYINFKNPAAFAAFDSLSFIADLSVDVVNQQLKMQKLEHKDAFAQLGYLAVGVCFTKIWHTSAGIMPFSDVGYAIVDTTKKLVVPETGDTYAITNRYTGTGGLQLLYWGNAFKVYKGLSLGINLGYLFGTINTSRFAEYNVSNALNTLFSNSRTVNGIYFSGGIQYQVTIQEKHHLGFGAVYENGIKVWSKENLLILNYMGTYSPNHNFDTVIRPAEKEKLKTIKMPHIVGGGFSYGYKDRVLASADVTWQNWKSFEMPNNLYDSLKNNIIAALGVQYVPNPMSSKYFNKINFRLGTRFASGYMAINNTPISEFAVSMGFGFPLRTISYRSSVNIMFEYSRLGTIQNDLILQNNFKLSFNFILQERWYQRRKLD